MEKNKEVSRKLPIMKLDLKHMSDKFLTIF